MPRIESLCFTCGNARHMHRVSSADLDVLVRQANIHLVSRQNSNFEVNTS